MKIDHRIDFSKLEPVAERVSGDSNNPARVAVENEVEMIVCNHHVLNLTACEGALNSPTWIWSVSITPHSGMENGRKNFFSGERGTRQFQFRS